MATNKYHNNENKRILTKDYLKKEYHQKEKSAIVVANETGYAQAVILRYLKKYNIPIHKISKMGRKIKSRKMSERRKNGRIPTWNKGKYISDSAIKKAQKKLIGRHLSPKTEFKKGHKVRKKGYKIHKHHIDLNKKNCDHDNILYLNISIHQKLHRHTYNYLVEKGLIQDYTKYFLKKFKVKLYTRKEYKNQGGDAK